MNIKLSLPLQLICVIGVAFLIAPYLSVTVVKVAYTFSALFKSLLSYVLPVIVFAFVLSGILSFEKNAPLVLVLLVIAIFISNGIVALISYAAASLVLPALTCTVDSPALQIHETLTPLFTLWVPTWISYSSVYILFIAALLGVFFSFFPSKEFKKSIDTLKGWVEVFVCNIFIPLLPLYVFGFMVKIRYEGTFISLFEQYGTTCLVIVGIQIFYLFWFYLAAAGFSFKKACSYIANAFPSYLTAFSTMSSTAAIPVTTKSAEENTGNAPLARMSVPIMANVHLLGDSVATPLLALVTLFVFKGCLPSFLSYMTFIPYFCIAMFGVAGLPGGGIIVMMPILKAQFGFTDPMTAIVISLYLLMDPFGTAANVMGDGALVIMVNKILKRFDLFSSQAR